MGDRVENVGCIHFDMVGFKFKVVNPLVSELDRQIKHKINFTLIEYSCYAHDTLLRSRMSH